LTEILIPKSVELVDAFSEIETVSQMGDDHVPVLNWFNRSVLQG
jgi:hypothetical protein